MQEHIFDSYPFAVFHFNQQGELQKTNARAKELLDVLDLTDLTSLLKEESLSGILHCSHRRPRQLLYYKKFQAGGSSDLLILIGERHEFWHDVPRFLAGSEENFPTDSEKVSQKIAGLISEALTFQRFDILRVDRSLRNYIYDFSIGAELVGNPHTAYLTIGDTGLGWIFKEEIPHLVASLTPDNFCFREDPLLYENGLRSILRVPILFEHGIVGGLMLANAEPGKYDLEDAFLIHQIANLVAQPFFHAGIQLKQHHNTLIGATLLHTVIDNIDEENIGKFLANYCEKLCNTLGMDRVSVFVLDQNQRKRRWLAEAGAQIQIEPEYLNQWLSIKNTGIEQMLQTKSIISFNLADPQLKDVENLKRRGFTSIIYSPLEDTKGKIVACLAGSSGDERALSSSIAGLFKIASEQLSLILAKLPQPILTNTEALKKNTKALTLLKGFETIIGSSAIMKQTIHKASLASKYDFPILLTGETGTGKELFAKAIHQSSSVANGPYITVNSAAIPANLLESELFGYQEGAFTGGLKGGKPGKIQLANGGTLFLDEIGDLPFDLQAKMLRVIQEKEIEPLGSTKPIPVNVRFISATNKNLHEMVEKGTFREDLLYRINAIEITLPPLRERQNDVLELAESMLAFLSNSHGVPLKRLSDEAKELLLHYAWPGNVRQLQNVMNRLFVFTEGHTIEAGDLPMDIRTNPALKTENEQEMIQQLLLQFNGNKTALADYLGISRTGLWKKLKRLGLQ
jgi:transcriptional regulator with GAF, ATPase, and Fis domain